MSGLPEGWVWTTLGEICSKPQYGWTTRGSKRGGIKLLRTTDIANGDIDWSSVPFCADDPPTPSKYQLTNGDIVISRAGSVGVSALLERPIPAAVFASYLIRFRASGTLPRLIRYYLQSPSYWAAISKNAAGIAIPNVNATKLAALRFPLAPLPEQHRIVAKIESLFAKLDDGVAALKRAQANLDRYRASVLKAAVEGRLTDRWRRENPPEETGEELLERILVERRKRWEIEQLAKFEAKGMTPPRNWKCGYKEPIAPDTNGLPELPEGWCWATVGQVATAIQYGHTASADPSKLDGPRFLRITDIQRGRVEWSRVPGCAASELESEKYRLRQGDIVFARTGATTGKSYLIHDPPEAIFASYLIRVGLCAPVHARYVSVFFQSAIYWAQIERGKRGIGQPNVNARVLARVTLPLPPRCEQVQIAQRVGDTENAVRLAFDRLLRDCLTAAPALRQSILKCAFEGRLGSAQACAVPSRRNASYTSRHPSTGG